MTRRELSSRGGRARAAALPPERRRAIARLGWLALVAKRFGGDRDAARDWITRKGLASQDFGAGSLTAHMRRFFDPGPMPGPSPPSLPETSP